MNELDPRIVRVSIEIGGALKIYEGLAITATGTKYANANQNDCEVKITNLDRETRNYLLTETSPFNKNRKLKRIIVEAGRVSYGYSKIFQGDIVAATPSQPPDITLTIKALTGDYAKGFLAKQTQTQQSKLSKVSKDASNRLGLSLNFQATEKNISNYAYSGSSLKEVDKIGELGNVDAFVDDDTLVVKDYDVPLNGKLRILDLTSGMIGIPELTEQGVKVKMLFDNKTVLGGALQIKSEIYPALNGTYIIYKLGFDIASRDTSFYLVAECKRLGNES